MRLRLAATFDASLIGWDCVIAITARRLPQRIIIRNRRLQDHLALRIGRAGGIGLNGRNEKRIFCCLSFLLDLPEDARVFFAASPRLGPLWGLSVRLNAARIHPLCVFSPFGKP